MNGTYISTFSAFQAFTFNYMKRFVGYKVFVEQSAYDPTVKYRPMSINQVGKPRTTFNDNFHIFFQVPLCHVLFHSFLFQCVNVHKWKTYVRLWHYQ